MINFEGYWLFEKLQKRIFKGRKSVPSLYWPNFSDFSPLWDEGSSLWNSCCITWHFILNVSSWQAPRSVKIVLSYFDPYKCNIIFILHIDYTVLLRGQWHSTKYYSFLFQCVCSAKFYFSFVKEFSQQLLYVCKKCCQFR